MFSLFWNAILVSSAYDPTSEPISLNKNCYLAQFSGVEFSVCSTGSMPYPSPIPSGLEEIYPSLATSSPLLQGLFPSWLSLQIIEYGLYILCLYLSLSLSTGTNESVSTGLPQVGSGPGYFLRFTELGDLVTFSLVPNLAWTGRGRD